MKLPSTARLSGALLASAFVLLLSGCTIVRQVTPVQPGTEISKIYVEQNPALLMNGFAPEVVSQLQQLGFDAELYSKPRPASAKHYMDITANWAWDMAMYLTYFKATLFEEGRVLGTAEYDARMGGANMGKFGKTAEKIRPILAELMHNVGEPRPTTAATAAH
jgi:hypothetical protein